MDETTKTIQDSYDEVGYVSGAYDASSPLKLEAIGTMLGLNPPATTSARVLEIGCSYGGNLIPFALANPGARVLGVDLSAEEIEGAKQIAKSIGLQNLEFKQMDICEFSPEDAKNYGEFDYIICHGVFSWVPQAVREAILRVVKGFLSPSGLAYISYNVYPGWKVKDTLRDLMLFSSNGRGGGRERLSASKEALRVFKEFLKTHSHPIMPIDSLIQEIENFENLHNDQYILHEFLAPINSPLYFKEFANMLENNGLSYLCESSLDDIFLSELGDEKTDEYMRKTFSHRYDEEQFMDFYTNKMFRSSLVVHQDAFARVVAREINPSDVAKLQVVGQFIKQEDGKFKGKKGALDDRFASLCDRLNSLYPASASLSDLLDGDKLASYMRFLNLLGSGALLFSLTPRQNLGYAPGKTRIKAAARAYLDYFMKEGTSKITFANVFGCNYALAVADCFVAAKFDGKNTIDSITADLHEFLKQNGMTDSYANGNLREFAKRSVAQTEFLLRECYFFEEI